MRLTGSSPPALTLILTPTLALALALSLALAEALAAALTLTLTLARIVAAGQLVTSAGRYVRYVPSPHGASSGRGIP